MACRLVALDKNPWVILIGIREALCRALAKLVLREASDQTKTDFGQLHICSGVEAII